MKSFKNIDADYRYPSIRLSIHYTQSDGTRKEMIVYDDDIDVGSEVINAKLTSIIYEYRSMYMFCSCHSPDITITEKQDGAWIVISWQGIIKMTFLNYE